MSTRSYIFATAVCVATFAIFFWNKERGDSGSQGNEDSDRRSYDALSERVPWTPKDSAKPTYTSGPNNQHHARPVKEGEISSEQILMMRKTMRPFTWKFPWRNKVSPGEIVDDPFDFIEHIISGPSRFTYPHSIYKGADYYYVWGTHSNTPKRGFAVRIGDGEVLLWAKDGNHEWADTEAKEMPSDPMVVRSYFFEKNDYLERLFRHKEALKNTPSMRDIVLMSREIEKKRKSQKK
jgi:hypothetical protein